MERKDATTSIGLLVLRVGIGAFLATHGWGKLQMLLAGEHEFGDPIGLGSTTSLALVTLAELGCSVLVIAGLATRVAAVPVVFAMGVAAFVVHGGDPWTMGRAAELFQAGKAETWASKEPALLYLIPFLALVFTGAGRLSLDARVGRRWRERRAAKGAGG